MAEEGGDGHLVLGRHADNIVANRVELAKRRRDVVLAARRAEERTAVGLLLLRLHLAMGLGRADARDVRRRGDKVDGGRDVCRHLVVGADAAVDAHAARRVLNLLVTGVEQALGLGDRHHSGEEVARGG